MKRRNFLRFFAAPAVAVVAPAAIAAIPEPEPVGLESKPPLVTSSTIKEILKEQIRICAVHQTWAHNAHDWRGFVNAHEQHMQTFRIDCASGGQKLGYPDHVIDRAKNDCSVYWTRNADRLAAEIEETARLLGFKTIWPGLYPEFEPIES